MSDFSPSDPKAATNRGRTASRHRFVAPEAFDLSPAEGVNKIGRYEIIETLGKGAMGVVYKARDPLLDRTVAVKTISSPRGVGRRVRKAYLERFEREAKAAAKMQHPAIVTIFDVGLDDALPFMVLEYLAGETLADRLDRVRMPLGKAVQIGLDLASALAFAHKQRIVHRDLKPANVLHAGEGRWKLADFGIARLPDSDLTQVGIFMGTPGYSPPEAIREGRYTPQADVFAWGAVLYELLTGAIPYEGPDTPTTNGYVLSAKAPPPTHYDGSVPQPISDVTMRALGSSTKVRFRDGAEAEHALKQAWEECLVSGVVAPASLTGVETPHERAPQQMHLLPTNVTPAPVPIHVAVSQKHSGANKHGARPAPPSAKAKGKNGPILIIESENSALDDDPTRIMVRDEDVVVHTSSTADTISDTHLTPDARHQGSAEVARIVTATPPSERMWLWVAVVVGAIVAGGLAAFLLIKM